MFIALLASRSINKHATASTLFYKDVTNVVRWRETVDLLEL